jgi:hypothetical protein
MKGSTNMTKQFNTSDAEGIVEYIKSLDLCNQFDEIIVDLLRRDSIDDNRIHEVRIMIKSLDRVIYRLQHHRNFAEEIFEFSKFFEQDIKFLSAAVLFLRKLKEIDSSLTDFNFEIKDFWVSANVSNEISSYTLNAMLDTNGNAVATVETSFSLDQRLLASKHSFRTKSAIEIEELKEVIEEFSLIKSAIKKGN